MTDTWSYFRKFMNMKFIYKFNIKFLDYMHIWYMHIFCKMETTGKHLNKSTFVNNKNN